MIKDIIECLKENSDPEHPLRLKDIKKLIEEKNYNLDKCTEVSIRQNIKKYYAKDDHPRICVFYKRNQRFIEFDLLEQEEMKQNGTLSQTETLYFCLAHDEENDLCRAETRLLQDAVYIARLLDRKQTERLIAKLNALLSKYSRNKYKDIDIRTTIEPYLSKTTENIQTILQAIDQNKCISFKYHKYDLEKGKLQLVPKREDIYELEPCSLMWYGGSYYLVGYYYSKTQDNGNIINFRADKLSEICILDKNKSHKHDFYPIDHRFKDINMFSSDPVEVRMRLKRDKLNNAVDTFGEHKMRNFELVNDHEVEFSVPDVSRLGVITWVLQFIEHCELIKPEELREEIKDILKNNVGKYGVNV